MSDFSVHNASLSLRSPAIYIIVGAPRSGTSALSLVFKEQGIVMFMEADAPDVKSPSGTQEDTSVRLLHNELMGYNGLGEVRDWDNPRYVPGTSSDVVEQLKAYIRRRTEHTTAAWGVKDPRLCFFIEPWYAATQGLTVHWIHIYREDREATIRSLIAMLPARLHSCGDPEYLYHLVANWAESYRLAIDLGFARTGIKAFRLSYEQLLTPEGQDRLAKHFGFQVPIRCIRPELNRQGKTNEVTPTAHTQSSAERSEAAQRTLTNSQPTHQISDYIEGDRRL
jgi:hypothetical protein